MIPVQISTKLEGKVYTATLRCVLKGQEHIVQIKGKRLHKNGLSVFEYLAKGRLEKVKRKSSSQCRSVAEGGRGCQNP